MDTMTSAVAVGALGIALALSACSSSSGGGGGGGGSDEVSLPGTWSGQFRGSDSAQDPLFVHDKNGTLTIDFEVSGEEITGTITIENDICVGSDVFTGDIEGTLDGTDLEFSYISPSDTDDDDSIPNQPVTFSAELEDPMQGEYDATACHPDDWVGTFELTQE